MLSNDERLSPTVFPYICIIFLNFFLDFLPEFPYHTVIQNVLADMATSPPATNQMAAETFFHRPKSVRSTYHMRFVALPQLSKINLNYFFFLSEFPYQTVIKKVITDTTTSLPSMNQTATGSLFP